MSFEHRNYPGNTYPSNTPESDESDSLDLLRKYQLSNNKPNGNRSLL